MRKKMAALALAFLLLMTGPVQTVLAFEKEPAGRTVVNSLTAEFLAAQVKVNARPTFSLAAQAVNKPKKKPVSRGSFGSFDEQKVIRIAVSLRGTPYKRNGERPGGFDCSGFTRYVYKAGAGIDLPHSSSEQAQYGTEVLKKNLAPGDLVFFNTSGSGISHVGIFIGGDNFISSTSSNGVKVTSLTDAYWGKRYITARRLGN